jgi:predicted aspartyl protease
MPHFLLPLHPSGPLIDAFVGVSAPRQATLLAQNQSIPNPMRVRALMDTGASSTCVDPSIVAGLGLTPTGQAQMCTPSTGTTPHVADQYDVSIVIPCSDKQPLIQQTIAVACVQLVAPQGFHVLIGRDILRHCVFTYDGARKLFILAY